ncbi:MAG: type IV pilus biogenesis/stability protein PilW [Gammaproteobacteria bacterium]|nr:type IV pilus biogenesis/stability protein PilW [Gammaproteobacteria bacterium]
MIARIVWPALLATLLTACAPVEPRPPMERELTPAQINLQLALKYYDNNRLRLALDKVNDSLTQAPQYASAHNVTALIYERLGQAELAQRHFSRALELSPDDPSARNNYGKFLCTQGRLREAEANFLAAADNPGNASPDVAYTNAGLCALRIPDLERAAQYFTAALNANPTMPTALYQVARIGYEKGRFPEARRDLQHYLQVARHTAETLWLSVLVERALGNEGIARRYAQRLQNHFPQSEETRLLFETELESASQQIPPVPPSTAAADGFRREPWLREQPASAYTLELFASQNESAMPYFRDEYGLVGDLAYYASQRGAATWYTLVWGSFDDAAEARQAATRLPAALRESSITEVRRFADIQAKVSTRTGF